MRYAIKYYRQQTKDKDILGKANEIIIRYYEKDPELVNFIDKIREDQRLVINATELETTLEENLPIFLETRRKKRNIAILCSEIQDFAIVKQAKIPFFFIEGCSTWDQLVGQVEEGVSDVYIINELGFYLGDIAKCYKGKVRIRVYPNIAQSSSLLFNNSFKKFFIRPEDVGVYEQLVDIMEFDGISISAQSALYDVYTQRAWNDNLQYIIQGLDYYIDTSTMLPLFGNMRTNCHKRCAIDKCQVCEHMKDIAEAIEETDLRIVKHKEEPETMDLASLFDGEFDDAEAAIDEAEFEMLNIEESDFDEDEEEYDELEEELENDEEDDDWDDDEEEDDDDWDEEWGDDDDDDLDEEEDIDEDEDDDEEEDIDEDEDEDTDEDEEEEDTDDEDEDDIWDRVVNSIL